MARVIHFDIVVPNPDRGIKFYEQAFGWMALVGDTEGNVFGLMEEDPSAK